VYAGLADTYTSLSDFYLPPREVIPQARGAAVQALALDETLPEAHNALGLIHFYYDWDWPATEREFKRAIELNPNFADAHHNYANFLAAMKRPEESRPEIELAEKLSPFSDQVLQDSIWVRWLNRQYDAAIARGQACIAMDPQYSYCHIILGLAFARKGQFQEAVAQGEAARKLDESPLLYGFLGSIYADAGKRDEAQKVIDTLEANMSLHYVCPYEIGTISLLLGNKDDAFRWYDKAIEVRSACMPFLWTDPRLDSVRADPRYQELVRRMKFPQ
jgi:tetratricopeptide (TPR) repeat protein